MTDYIKHSSCTNFTIYSTCTSTGQAFKFTQSGTESIMYGGTNTGEDLKIQANDADTYPYIKMEGDSHIKLYSSDDIYFYDDATEEFRFYDNSIDIKGDRAIYINDDETYIGHGAGDSITDGVGNTLIGHDAGNDITTGDYNTIIGYESMDEDADNNNCVCIGAFAGENNTQSGIVAIGFEALEENTGEYAVAVGYQTLTNNTGEQNVAVGSLAGSSVTDGVRNVLIGHGAGFSLETGDYNVAVGRSAGNNNVTGSSNIFLGYSAGFSETGSNKLYINNSDSAYPLIYGEFDNDVVKIGNNSDDFGLIFDVSTATISRIYGGENSGDMLQIYNNSADERAMIQLGTNVVLDGNNAVQFSTDGTNYGYVDGGDATKFIMASYNDRDISFQPNGTGLVRFGTYAALSGETVTGYITIKDAGGTSRKLAVVA